MTSSTNFPGPVKVQGRYVVTAEYNEDGSIRALVDGDRNAVITIPGPERGERQRLLSLVGSTIFADLKNPSAGVALTSYPCEIRVSFAQGEVYSADQLIVKNESGTVVSWQWEGAYDFATNSSIATWTDGSLRAGSVWVVASLSAGATKRYSIEVNGSEQGQSYSAAVSYTVVSGTVEEYATSAMRARFESAQGWQLRRYQDIGNSSFDLFTGANGVYAKYQISSGVAKQSYTAADITSVVKSRPSAGSFGEGVVFRDWRVTFAWAAEPTTTVQMDYRMFADGSIRIRQRIDFTAASASNAKQLFLQAAVGATGLTSATDTTRQINRYDYTGSPFLLALTDAMRDYPAKTTQTHTLATIQETTTSARFGWTGTTDVPAGAFFLNSAILTRYTAADQVNEHLRRVNPVVSFAAVPKRIPDRLSIRSRAQTLVAEAAPLLSAAEWGGVGALLTLASGGAAATALAQFQAWATLKGVTPTSAASWMALWNGGTGLEYTGRNTQCLHWLKVAFIANGDTTNQALVESYIHAFADFCVSAETASGGAGAVWLSQSTGVSAYNAALSCMSALAASIAITANAGRQTVYDRILAAYVAGAWGGQKWNYNGSTAVPNDVSGHYYAYQTFELARAKALLPATSLPAGSLCSYLRQNIGAEGQIDDLRFNLFYRRGRESTQFYAAACLVMLEADYAAAYEMIRRVAALSARYAVTGIDGFGVTDSTNVAMDTRPLAELLLAGGI